MMEFEQNGFTFTDQNETAISLNKYASSKRVKVHAFLAKKGDYKTIVLYTMDGQPEFESQSAEEIAVHIDIMAMQQRVK